MRFYLVQFIWYRRLTKGKYYYMDVLGLPIFGFWTDEIVTSCQAKIRSIEDYT